MHGETIFLKLLSEAIFLTMHGDELFFQQAMRFTSVLFEFRQMGCYTRGKCLRSPL
jgi:hypothetical protein